MTHFIPPTFNALQFAYRKSSEDPATAALHAILSCLERRGNCAHLVFIDFSSAFIYIYPIFHHSID